MTSCGFVFVSFVVEFGRAAALGWSLALGISPALILRLLWKCFGLLSYLLFSLSLILHASVLLAFLMIVLMVLVHW